MMNRRILQQKAMLFFQSIKPDGWNFTGRSFYNIESASFVGEFSQGINGKVERRNMAVSAESVNEDKPVYLWLE